MLPAALLAIPAAATITPEPAPAQAPMAMPAPESPSVAPPAATPAQEAPARALQFAPAGGGPATGQDMPGDPFEGVNRFMFKVNDGIDTVFYPVSVAYRKVVPKPVRKGFGNVLRNLTEPVVFVNDLLQLRPGRAMRTFARFMINSTAGVGGLLDIAKTADLPHRDNGLGNTFARYGIKGGFYLFVPFFGPATARDFVGNQVDLLVLPLSIGTPFDRLGFQIATGAVSGLNQRVEFDSALRAIRRTAADRYATIRSLYLQSRAAEVAEIRGAKSALPQLDDPLQDPAIRDDRVAPGGEGGPAQPPPPADAPQQTPPR